MYTLGVSWGRITTTYGSRPDACVTRGRWVSSTLVSASRRRRRDAENGVYEFNNCFWEYCCIIVQGVWKFKFFLYLGKYHLNYQKNLIFLIICTQNLYYIIDKYMENSSKFNNFFTFIWEENNNKQLLIIFIRSLRHFNDCINYIFIIFIRGTRGENNISEIYV